MSVLILLKKKSPDGNGVEYTILKQAERMTNTRREPPNGPTILFESGGWIIKTMGWPELMVSSREVFLRGYRTDLDDSRLRVPWRDIISFEELILGFNQKYSNNTNLEMEDVIW